MSTAGGGKSNRPKSTRGRMSRIQRLPAEIKQALDQLLASGVPQTSILKQLKPLLTEAGERPLSAAGLNRYATQMEVMGRRIRESREIAEVWTTKFGDKPSGELSQHIINMLRHLAFEFVLHNDGAVNEDGGAVIDPATINTLAGAVQRMERAAATSTQREKELRQAWQDEARKKLKKSGKQAGLSDEAIELSRKVMTGEI